MIVGFCLSILGLIMVVSLFNECKSDGYSSAACFALVNQGNYLIVDALD
jgi:hypothetical protein